MCPQFDSASRHHKEGPSKDGPFVLDSRNFYRERMQKQAEESGCEKTAQLNLDENFRRELGRPLHLDSKGYL
jgi:hypothetical protein